MVATDSQSLQAEAALAIKEWKTTWEMATFGTDDKYENLTRETSLSVKEVLQIFGPRLVELGSMVWAVRDTPAACTDSRDARF